MGIAGTPSARILSFGRPCSVAPSARTLSFGTPGAPSARILSFGPKADWRRRIFLCCVFLWTTCPLRSALRGPPPALTSVRQLAETVRWTATAARSIGPLLARSGAQERLVPPGLATRPGWRSWRAGNRIGITSLLADAALAGGRLHSAHRPARAGPQSRPRAGDLDARFVHPMRVGTTMSRSTHMGKASHPSTDRGVGRVNMQLNAAITVHPRTCIRWNMRRFAPIAGSRALPGAPDRHRIPCL